MAPVVVLYFTLIVFAGAFFLLNLTLAVINSKFTEAHNAHQNGEKDKLTTNNQVF
jgi:preprotein translocase subunit SecG